MRSFIVMYLLVGVLHVLYEDYLDPVLKTDGKSWSRLRRVARMLRDSMGPSGYLFLGLLVPMAYLDRVVLWIIYAWDHEKRVAKHQEEKEEMDYVLDKWAPEDEGPGK
jgi:hypothetical protein